MIFLRLLTQTIGLALGQLRANKGRAALTSLGIIIGVSSVVTVIAALGGMKSSVLSEFETFGAKKMWIWGDIPQSKRGLMSWLEVLIRPEEVEAIREHAPSIASVTPIVNDRYTVMNGDLRKTGVRVTGIAAEWHRIENRQVTLGHPFNAIDDEGRRQVCLINDKGVEELQLDADPVGDFLMIGGRRFLIIGVVETKDVGMMFGGGETLSELFVPFSTAIKMDPWGWPYLMAETTEPEKAEEARAEVRFVLRTMRQLEPEDEDTFGIEVMQQHIDQFRAMAAGITMIAGGVVSVSLLVGGIGIMNIMLVSVSERTREIGLRKAVGARPGVILTQFLTEAVVLCLAGGLVGILLGQAMTLGLQSIPDANLDQAQIPLWAIALAVGFSASVGVVFGMFPAIKAARLNPIDALRHE